MIKSNVLKYGFATICVVAAVFLIMTGHGEAAAAGAVLILFFFLMSML